MKTKVRYELQGKEFALRFLEADDLNEDYLGWLRDPEVNRFLEVRYNPPTKETAIEHLNTYDQKMRFFWGIYAIEDDRFIGTITLSKNPYEDSATYGYLIGNRKYWGTSAASEAIALSREYAFEELGLRRVGGGANEKNIGSLFNFKKLGFVHEGTQRQIEVIEGVITDSYTFGILKHEWEERRKHLNLY